ncbi:MAG: hypothetical protein QG674_350 [Patescibacteria group bacterium]|jgi:hypothetical protein|nr:hypothetical protein [Patescibacteria group bacterium]
MLTKKQIIIFLISLLLIIGFIVLGFKTSEVTKPSIDIPTTNTDGDVWPSSEVEKVSIDQNTSYAQITGSYPKTVSDSISMYFKSFLEDQVDQFINDTSWAGEIESASSQSLMLDITYKNVRSSNVETYIFTVNSYTGGAHGMQFRKTFSFTKGGQLLTLSNIFSNGFDGLPTFAKIVQKELLARPGAQSDWIAEGAGAKEENYQSFVVTDQGLTILFDPYQVAPWSDGAIDIDVPLKSFANIANKNIFTVNQ